MSHENRVRILITLAVFLCAISLTFVSRADGAVFTPQGAQADKPVERTFKNIQVLKGLREPELYQTMNFMAVSLGEQCTFCHVTKGKDPKTGQNIWVWERAINHAAVLPIPEQFDFEDYRDVDGVKLPFIIRRSAIDTYDSWTRTFAEIKRNVAVDDALFAPPAAQP